MPSLDWADPLLALFALPSSASPSKLPLLTPNCPPSLRSARVRLGSLARQLRSTTRLGERLRHDRTASTVSCSPLQLPQRIDMRAPLGER